MDKWLVIPDDGHPYEQEPAARNQTLPQLQELVGGYIETVRIFCTRYVLVINEEGKLHRLALNPIATRLWNNPFEVICGTAVLAKIDLVDGEPDICPLSRAEIQEVFSNEVL